SAELPHSERCPRVIFGQARGAGAEQPLALCFTVLIGLSVPTAALQLRHDQLDEVRGGAGDPVDPAFVKVKPNASGNRRTRENSYAGWPPTAWPAPATAPSSSPSSNAKD